MWYFTWIVGVGFIVLLGILNAIWGEHEDARKAALAQQPKADATGGGQS